jgi:predicted RNA-binding Zn-ribbon protein involved in translation (DUF1610 family)
MNHYKDAAAVDISDVQPSQGDYVCPFCGVVMLPTHYSVEAVSLEVQCPSCGYKLDPTTDQTKHASKLTPKITEEMISEEEEGSSIIFEVVADEDSSRAGDEDEDDPFAEDDRRVEESLRRKGYKILSANSYYDRTVIYYLALHLSIESFYICPLKTK